MATAGLVSAPAGPQAGCSVHKGRREGRATPDPHRLWDPTGMSWSPRPSPGTLSPACQQQPGTVPGREMASSLSPTTQDPLSPVGKEMLRLWWWRKQQVHKASGSRHSLMCPPPHQSHHMSVRKERHISQKTTMTQQAHPWGSTARSYNQEQLRLSHPIRDGLGCFLPSPGQLSAPRDHEFQPQDACCQCGTQCYTIPPTPTSEGWMWIQQPPPWPYAQAPTKILSLERQQVTKQVYHPTLLVLLLSGTPGPRVLPRPNSFKPTPLHLCTSAPVTCLTARLSNVQPCIPSHP